MPNNQMDEAEQVRQANAELTAQRPPYHPDFDRITRILQRTDGDMDAGGDVEQYIAQFIDPATLLYIADQRAVRGLALRGIERGHPMFDLLRTFVGACFLDGWINGRQFGNEPRSRIIGSQGDNEPPSPESDDK